MREVKTIMWYNSLNDKFAKNNYPAVEYDGESNWEGEPDPQDGDIKFGVQITPFEEIYKKYKQSNSTIYVRRIYCDPQCFSPDTLKKIHDVVYDKTYDIIPDDWLEALWRKDSHPQKTNRFWCSALVGYIYTQCNLLHPDTDWSILRPSDFSIQYNTLPFVGMNRLGSEDELK